MWVIRECEGCPICLRESVHVPHSWIVGLPQVGGLALLEDVKSMGGGTASESSEKQCLWHYGSGFSIRLTPCPSAKSAAAFCADYRKYQEVLFAGSASPSFDAVAENRLASMALFRCHPVCSGLLMEISRRRNELQNNTNCGGRVPSSALLLRGLRSRWG